MSGAQGNTKLFQCQQNDNLAGRLLVPLHTFQPGVSSNTPLASKVAFGYDVLSKSVKITRLHICLCVVDLLGMFHVKINCILQVRNLTTLYLVAFLLMCALYKIKLKQDIVCINYSLPRQQLSYS